MGLRRGIGDLRAPGLWRAGPGAGRAVLLSLAIALGADAGAAPLECTGAMVTVAAPGAALAERLCAVAARATAQFHVCGMVQTEPVHVEVLDCPLPGDPDCAGRCDCRGNRIALAVPGRIIEALGEGHPFAAMPAADLYDSLLVHELAHAFAYQTRGGPLTSVAATEYVAYAMQFEFLPAAVRDAFVAAHPVARPVRPVALNDVILAFSPGIFAVKAWLHFRQPGNGCGFVRGLLDGTVSLPRPNVP